MPLINCPECQNEISDKASTCPQCGFPTRKAAIERKLSKTLSTASSGAKRVIDALALRKAKFKAIAECVVIFLVGALLFPLVVRLGAICICIYSVALFKTIRVVWKRAVTAQSQTVKTEASVPGTKPDDDTRFMPPDMRAATTKPIDDTTCAEPLTRNPKAEAKHPAPEPDLSSLLPITVVLFVLFAMLSLILRPYIKAYIRNTCMSQNVPTRTYKQEFRAVNSAVCATNLPSPSSSTNCVTAWKTVTNVANVVLGYPSDLMEEQSSDDQAKGDSLRKSVLNLAVQPGAPTLRLQQKGLSARDTESFKTFMRIAVAQSDATPSVITVFGGLSEATAEDVREIDESMKTSLTQTYAEMSLKSGKVVKLLSGPSSKVITLAGVLVLKTTIRHKTDIRPIVIQTEYKALRNNTLITITTQFREEERERWERAVDSVISSLQFR